VGEDIAFVLATSILALITSFKVLSFREKEQVEQNKKMAQMLIDLQEKNDEIILSFETMIFGLTNAMELRDQETNGHSQRVSRMTSYLARKYYHFTEEELKNIYYGALLHDIGKLGIPDSVLLKPGRLSLSERAIIEKHPVYAKEWLSKSQRTIAVQTIPYTHHERWDGRGYPQGLKGTSIPQESRLFTVIDCADAIGSQRPYHQPLPPDEVYAWLEENSGLMFSPDIVKLFIQEDMLRRQDLIGDYYVKNEQAISLVSAFKEVKYAR
jgi:response regulator RpfG family c-di-GMP phosphodiesterase